MSHDERIARDVSTWVGEDIRTGVEHFRNSGFENRLRQRLALEDAVPARHLWLPTAAAVAVLAVVVGVFIYFQPPSFQTASGRESIRTFFAKYSTLQRLQVPADTITAPAHTIQLPGLAEGRPSRQEIAELFRYSLPVRDLGIRELETPGRSNASPRELKQAIDRFFSTTLKSIKEKT
jgi:hypothetical protein